MAMLTTPQESFIQRRKRLGGLASAMTGQQPAFTAQETQFPQEAPMRAMAAPTSTPAQTPYKSSFLAPGYGYNELATYEEGRRNQFGNTASNDILSTRDKLASSLGDYSKRFFEQQNPYILEDLNSRGLLTSPSAVNTAQTDALKELGLENEKYLRDFDTSALSARLQAQQDALDSGLDLRRGGLDQQFEDAASNREEALARDLAKKQNKNNLINSLIGVGGSLGGSLLTAKMLGGAGAAKAAAAAGAGTATAGAAPLIGGAGWAGAGGATGAGAGGVPLASAATPGATGIGLGGAAAIGATGIGAAMLSRAAEKKGGAAAGILANPIGYQINKAKELVTNPGALADKAFGGSKSGDTTGIAGASQAIQGQLQQLRDLKSERDAGRITPEQYQEMAAPIASAAKRNVESAVVRGSKWASNINPTWQAFQNEGFVKADSGRWIFEDGTVI